MQMFKPHRTVRSILLIPILFLSGCQSLDDKPDYEAQANLDSKSHVALRNLYATVTVHTLASLIHDGHHPHHEKTFFLPRPRQEA